MVGYNMKSTIYWKMATTSSLNYYWFKNSTWQYMFIWLSLPVWYLCICTSSWKSAVQIFSSPRNSNSHVQTTVLRSCARYFWHTCVVFTQLRTFYTSSIGCDIHQGVLKNHMRVLGDKLWLRETISSICAWCSCAFFC